MNPNQEQGEFNYSAQQPPAGGQPSTVVESNTPVAATPTSQPVSTGDPSQETTRSLQEAEIQWQASEFVDHKKNPGWFLLLAVGAVVLCGLIFILTRSILSTVVVGIAVIAFGVVANQRPRTLTYALFGTGLQVGDKQYIYDDFRSFSVVQDGALQSIILQPNKRFMPPLTVYFAPEDGEKIFDVLATHLPHEERQVDSVDQLMRKIRF